MDIPTESHHSLIDKAARGASLGEGAFELVIINLYSVDFRGFSESSEEKLAESVAPIDQLNSR